MDIFIVRLSFSINIYIFVKIAHAAPTFNEDVTQTLLIPTVQRKYMYYNIYLLACVIGKPSSFFTTLVNI